MQTTDCGIIILAAGNSSRLGKPKQLLPYQNKTLLQHAIDEAVAVQSALVLAVTGANGDTITSQLQHSQVQITCNANWQEGMGSSIRTGLSALLEIKPSLYSVIIMLCDQPYVSAQLLTQLIQTKKTSGKGIVACSYKKIAGVPALFDKIYFEQLLSLKAQDGAKKMLTANQDDVATIPFSLGSVDIDTEQDYEVLLTHVSQFETKKDGTI